MAVLNVKAAVGADVVNFFLIYWMFFSNILNDLIIWKYSWDEKEEYIKDLLLYCGQDSLAMLEIYKKVKL